METKRFTVIVSIITVFFCILTVVYNFASMPAYGDTTVSAVPIYNAAATKTSQIVSYESSSNTQSYQSTNTSLNSVSVISSQKTTSSKTAVSSKSASSSKVSVSFPVNINTANAAELCSIPYIGETKAAAIIEYRNAHGGFKSVDELDNVKGFGTATINKIRQYITI